MTPQELIAENNRRKANREQARNVYDPLSGRGCAGTRVEARWLGGLTVYVPQSMLQDAEYHDGMTEKEFCRLRIRHDFEYWAARCVKVKKKGDFCKVPFVLNASQRYCLAAMEEQREAQKPVRIIILKARQWGCSTLIETYLAWLQIVVREYCNGVICSNTRDSATTIRRMYQSIIADYPSDLLPEDVERFTLKPVTGSNGIFEIPQRHSTLQVATANSPDAVRGSDVSLAHLSEVAFWGGTRVRNATNVIASIASTVPLKDGTMLIIESTANGIGNYFHTEWLRAVAGLSDKRAVFVPWYVHEEYRLPLPEDIGGVWESLTDYERNYLWNTQKLTLEQVLWYHERRRSYESVTSMMAEFPTDANEAFASTMHEIFAPEHVENLRAQCVVPVAVGDVVGDAITGCKALVNVRFVAAATGALKIWAFPEKGARAKDYVIAVDIGGRSEASDYSVIAVVKRAKREGELPEVVAQWRGHIDHDLLAWRAAMIATWYANALLIVESNTLETDCTEGEHGEYILETISKYYRNLYRRGNSRLGFQTNRSTKSAIINTLIAMVRSVGYIERDNDALNEFLTYERKSNGSFGAIDGKHDDILMTRAIALHYIANTPLPTPIPATTATQAAWL